MKIAITIVLVIIAIALTCIVLAQEGKNQGLGAVTGGSSETYWSKNKGRSKDAVIQKITLVLAILFFVLSLLLSSKWI